MKQGRRLGIARYPAGGAVAVRSMGNVPSIGTLKFRLGAGTSCTKAIQLVQFQKPAPGNVIRKQVMTALSITIGINSIARLLGG